MFLFIYNTIDFFPPVSFVQAWGLPSLPAIPSFNETNFTEMKQQNVDICLYRHNIWICSSSICWGGKKTPTQQDIHIYWFYFLNSLSMLAVKGRDKKSFTFFFLANIRDFSE